MKSFMMAVLLIAAVGAGVYFLYLKKRRIVLADSPIQKELIVGKWKLDSLSYFKDATGLFTELASVIDSNFMHYAYQFQPDGRVVRLFRDSVQKDNSHYEWTKEDQLLVKQEIDSVATKFTVSKLNRDSLILQSLDSTIAFFSKLK